MRGVLLICFWTSSHWKNRYSISLIRFNLLCFDRFKGVLRFEMGLLRFLVCFSSENKWLKNEFWDPKRLTPTFYALSMTRIYTSKRCIVCFVFFWKNEWVICHLPIKRKKKEGLTRGLDLASLVGWLELFFVIFYFFKFHLSTLYWLRIKFYNLF